MPYYLSSALEVYQTQQRNDRLIECKRPAGTEGRDINGSTPGAVRALRLGNFGTLLWCSEALSAHPNLTLLSTDKLEKLAATTRNRLQNLCGDGRTYSGQTDLGTALVDLMRNAPAGRWNPLRPSKTRQRYELWFGQDSDVGQPLYVEPAFIGPNSKQYADNFSTGSGDIDGTTLPDGANSTTWGKANGTDTIDKASGTAGITNHGDNDFVTYNTVGELDTDDGEVQIDITAYARATSSFLKLELGLRGFTTPATGYGFSLGYNSSNAIDNVIYLWVDDSAIATDGSVDISTGLPGTHYASCDGTTLTWKWKGSNIVAPFTDTNYSGGAGDRESYIGSYATGTTNDYTVDNFLFADIVAAGAGGLLRSLAHRKDYRSLLAR